MSISAARAGFEIGQHGRQHHTTLKKEKLMSKTKYAFASFRRACRHAVRSSITPRVRRTMLWVGAVCAVTLAAGLDFIKEMVNHTAHAYPGDPHIRAIVLLAAVVKMMAI